MKKIITILMAAVLMFAFVGCGGADIEECVVLADQAINDCKPYIDTCYGFFADFSEEEMTYTIATYVDEKEVERVVAGIETDYPATVKAGTISALDTDTSLIKGNLNLLREAAEKAFKGTKVKVITCHIKTDGNVVTYD